MGRAIAETSAAARGVFEMAEAVFPGVTRLCFEGPAEVLKLTCNTQPCLVTVELALLEAALERGLLPDVAAGFSLGEVAALRCAGVFSREEAVAYAVKRGALMHEAAEAMPGGMAAILKAEAGQVEAWCAEIAQGWAEAVNYNAPGQTVVAGDEPGLAALKAVCAENKARFMPLQVSGAFHSRAMKPASARLRDVATTMPLRAPALPWYPNVSGRAYQGEPLAELTAMQAASPVRWEATVRAMLADGVSRFIEIGPGGVLCGLIKRIAPEALALPVEDPASLEAAL